MKHHVLALKSRGDEIILISFDVSTVFRILGCAPKVKESERETLPCDSAIINHLSLLAFTMNPRDRPLGDIVRKMSCSRNLAAQKRQNIA